MPKILLVEDHRIVRQGIRALLEGEPDFEIVGEADDGAEAIRLIKEVRPEVVVIDLMLGNTSGIEVIRQAVPTAPGIIFIVLSMYRNEAYVAAALQAGARGYVFKGGGVDELARAIRETMAGRRYLSPPISEESIREFNRRAQASESTEFNKHSGYA